jgi:TRAP-type mannitol/chloroaromatic compound transport system permease large subunit
VLLIVYGATAGVSVVQLYAGAFFPGIMLAGLYVGYVVVLAKFKPKLMPPLSAAERHVELPSFAKTLSAHGANALSGLVRAIRGGSSSVSPRTALAQLLVSLLPLLAVAGIMAMTYRAATAPEVVASTAGLVQAGGDVAADIKEETADQAGGLAEPPAEEGGAQEPPGAAEEKKEAQPAQEAKAEPKAAVQAPAAPEAAERLPVPIWFWGVLAGAVVFVAVLYWAWNWQRLEVFKMLLASFFPLALLILAVLGSIVLGLATPTEAAAVGAFGGFILAAIYRYVAHARSKTGGDGAALRTIRELGVIAKDSSFLTAKTSAMVCWLFVGSSIFSAAFALLGGQELVEKWVLSLGLTPIQFMVLAQFIIFILGWPLEWTEIIVIFMPIFIPLLPKFGIDPLFFGLLVALNLQTAFLSPPVAMAAFYLKGVAPKHVTLNQIFAGMMPFMAIQVVALVLLYVFPGIGLWLPSVLYGR